MQPVLSWRVITGNPFPAAHQKPFQCKTQWLSCGWHACQRSLNILFSKMGDRAQHMAHGMGQDMCQEGEGGLSSACVFESFLLLASTEISPMIELRQLTWKTVYWSILFQDHAPSHSSTGTRTPKECSRKGASFKMHSNCSADVAPPALWSGVLLRSQVHLMACLSAFLDRRQITNWVGTRSFFSQIDCGVALIISNYVSKDTKDKNTQETIA